MVGGTNAPSFAGGRLAPGLRIATHNVQGMAGRRMSSLVKVHQLFKIWCELNLDIVCVQETKIAADNSSRQREVQQALDAAAARHGHPGFEVQWGCNTASSAGVALLFRKDLPLEMVGGVHRDDGGRLIHVRCKWAGHDFKLICTYLPSGDPRGQQDFITDVLQPILESSPVPVVMAGDWNFTPDWRRDRLWSAAGTAHHRDEGPALAFTALHSPPLVDAYRHLHPHRRSFTWHGRAGGEGCTASRLDRIYVSPELATRVFRCKASPLTVSDHRPVFLHLLPITPVDRGRGMRRTRMDFWQHEQQRVAWSAWLEEKAQSAPEDPQTLLAWWPSFKRDLASYTASLNRACRPQRDPSEEERAARQALEEATADAESTRSPAAAENIKKVLAARRRFILASVADAGRREVCRRFAWIRCGERPSPLLTKLIRPPKASRYVAALRCLSGGLVTDGREMARLMAVAFAAFSVAPPADPAAMGDVISAIHKHASPIPHSVAEAAGAAAITPEEVASAVRLTQPGTSPGPDGIPPELWRRGGDVLHDLLAKVYSAIGQLGDIPAEMLDGIVVPIFKAGDAAFPGNYRPITLLNTDYRLLTKILNARLAPALAKTLGPEQTAFLPHRLIGDGISFMQLLPEVLKANAARGLPSSAVLAFLDFRKAYDTVSRTFLRAAMEALGAGPGLIRWTSTLLSSTKAAANVNGHISQPICWTAGVRQGCPLSPALYLFVAAALLCWLKECPSVGVEVIPGRIMHATQYADDTQPLLTSLDPEVIQAFLDHMDVFRRASGQALNPSKTRLLVIGDASAFDPCPSTVCGLQVVKQAESLGVSFSNAPAAATSRPEVWEDLLSRVKNSFERISRLGLSVFGRAQAASAYGISQILHQAEHLGLPDDVRDQLHSLTTRLVDRGQVALRRGQPRWPLPGIPSDLLAGRPADGGFGALPWRQHCLARAARWIGRLLQWMQPASEVTQPSASASPPSGAPAAGTQPSPPNQPPPQWVPLVLDVFQRLCPSIHPAFAVLALGSSTASAGSLPTCLGTSTLLPGPLRRWAIGFHALGPVTDLGADPLKAGEWCIAAPLWGNPLLQLELPLSARKVQWEMAHDSLPPEEWMSGYPDMVGFPGLHTLRDLLSLFRALSKLTSREQRRPADQPPPSWDDRQATLFSAVFGPSPRPLLPQRFHLLFSRGATDLYQKVEGMWHAVPAAWRTAAFLYSPSAQADGRKLLPGTPTWSPPTAAAVELILSRLGWRQGDRRVSLVGGGDYGNGAAPVPLTVRSATQLLMPPVLELRQQARQRFVQWALSEGSSDTVAAADVTSAATNLGASMRSLWQLPWENARKETFWRLTVNGVSAAGGHDIAPSGPCACGWSAPPAGDEQASRSMQLQHHVFWSCPVASAIRATLVSALPPSATLPCSSVWLMQAPSGVQAEVWAVVCAAAIEAMGFGHRFLWALHRGQEEQEELLDPTQSLITAFFPPVVSQSSQPPEDPTSALVRRASHRAVALFWSHLVEFVSLAHVPKGWTAVSATHPFIGVLKEGERASLQLNLPPDVLWEDTN